MNEIQAGSIVVAVDGSTSADRAACWAAEQAVLEHRPLVVASVGTDVVLTAPAGLGAVVHEYPEDERRKVAHRNIDSAIELVRQHRPELAVQGLALFGEPRPALLELSGAAHMIVLGSRGRGSVTSKLLGSVSAAVSKHASCPVVVCRPGTELTVKKGILVGADATPDSLPVIEFAFRQAALRSQALTVLHCIWDVLATVHGPRVITTGTEETVEEARLLLGESVAGFHEKYPDVYVDLQVARGSAGDCLAAAADHHDLVVVGRHPAESIGRRVAGTVATAVLERSHTNVAVVPEAVTS
jgi:nucleotide-binding universal stress UspA family protein